VRSRPGREHARGLRGRAQLLKVLSRRGAAGIFWHTVLNGRDPFYTRLDAIYRDHAPALHVPDLHAAQELNDRRKEEELLAWEQFCDWRVIRYYDRPSYDAQGYVDLLRTWSTHTELGEEFFAAVASAVEEAEGRIGETDPHDPVLRQAQGRLTGFPASCAIVGLRCAALSWEPSLPP